MQCHRRAPRRPAGGRAEGRRRGDQQHARCAPPAGGVTAACDAIDYERFSSSAAGATPAAGSASGQALLGPRGPERPQARRATSVPSCAWPARMAAHLL